MNPIESQVERGKKSSRWFWQLMPTLAINEIFFGQRLPKVEWTDQSPDKVWVERSVVPCPHCEYQHDGRTWSLENETSMGNWFGLYCPNCGDVIPCMMNVFTRIIYYLTYPLHFWMHDSLRQRWLTKQPARFENLNFDLQKNPFAGKGWILQGLSWGAFMFVFMTLIYPLFYGADITMVSILIGLIIWTIGGLGFGYIMKLIMFQRPKNSSMQKM